MKISMKQSDGSSTAHDIRVEFTSGAQINLMVSGTETAIDVYKAIIYAYEKGEEDNANFNLMRNIKETVKKARG